MARVADASGNFPNGVTAGGEADTGAGYDTDNARTLVDITPSDTVDIPPGSHTLFVGGVGNVTFLDKAGVSHLFTAVAANTRLPISAKRVMATGTTATLIQALY